MLLGAIIASMAGGGSGPTPPTPSYWGLHFVAEEAGAQIGMANVGSPDSVTLEYSTDNGSTWATFTPGTTTVTLASVGDTACFRAGSGGNTKIGKAQNDYRKFTTTKKCACHGNIMSLLNGTDDATATAATMAAYCFRCLFRESAITTAPDFPATTLSDYCYDNIFRACTELTTPMSNLPALVIPQYAYRSMFYECSSLTTAPALPATTLADYSYAYMFYGCTALTSIPEIEANVTLAKMSLSYIFYGCTALTSAVLTIKSIYAQSYVQSLEHMFGNCSNLSSITVAWTKWNDLFATYTTDHWVDGVAATGTFYCPAALNTSSPSLGRNPSGWTVVNI